MNRMIWTAGVAALSLSACQPAQETAPAATDGAAGPPVVGQPVSGGDPPGVVRGGGSGELNEQDQRLPDGRPYEQYPLTVQAGDTVTIELEARFRPQLMILDANQQMLSESQPMAANADGGWSLGYENVFRDGGTYYLAIAAAPGETNQTGAWSMTMRTTAAPG